MVNAGSRLRIEDATSHGALVLLERGHVRTRLAHTNATDWMFAAGPFEVHTSGTRFELNKPSSRRKPGEQSATGLAQTDIQRIGPSPRAVDSRRWRSIASFAWAVPSGAREASMFGSSPTHRFVLVFFSVTSALTSCGGNSSSGTPVDKASSNEKSLFVLGVLAPDTKSCTVNAERGSTLLGKGVLDLALTSSYTATLLVGNQFQTAASTPSAPQTERISLRGAEVALATASGTPLGTYTTVGTGFVDTATDTSAYGSIVVTIVPATLHEGVSLQGEEPIVATVKVTGEALDGTLMTSSTLTFPIDVCLGCLVQYPLSAADPTVPPGSTYKCVTDDANSADSTATPCIMGQDTAFSCTLCSAALELCRDPAQNPSYN